VAKVIRVGLLVVSAGYLINYFAGSNVALLIVGNLLTGAGVVPMSMLTGLLIIDLAEYNEYRGMRRLEGSLSAVNGFAKKVGAGIGSGILGIIIGLAGYDGTLAVQPDSALTMIRLLYSLIPMVLYLGVYLAYRFYRLDRNIDEIRRVNEENRKNYVTGEHAEGKDSSTAG
ncbi:MAG: MFS transporter, partial [Lachnospiraceae bacterium]|nr:MFS transporter [Lachnospiraceae bacterium]